MHNKANILTIARMFLAPIFMIPIVTRIPFGEFIAAVIFVIAAITDALDGYIARKEKTVTRMGKFLDPLADKLLVTAALITLAWMGQVGPLVAFVIISREFAVSGLRTIAAAEGVVIAASKLGKIKTITQIVAITALTIQAGLEKGYSLLHMLFSYLPVDWITLISLYLAVVMTIVSGVDYFYKNWSVIEQG